MKVVNIAAIKPMTSKLYKVLYNSSKCRRCIGDLQARLACSHVVSFAYSRETTCVCFTPILVGVFLIIYDIQSTAK